MNYRELCENYLQAYGGKAFLTPSCTSALELSVILSQVGPGDEVILPSFTFSSCANAVIGRGGVPVFVDIELDTLNISPWHVSHALTEKTKAVMPVHYAGVSPDWLSLFPACYGKDLKIIEDSAQCIGDFRLTGDFACFSFHRTKNASCGEGGALLVKDPGLWDKANTLRNCGTTCFKEKDWDWVEYGTHALMGEQTAEVLWKSLQTLEERSKLRKKVWAIYREGIEAREKASRIGNAHIFWFLTEDRDRVMSTLNEKGIRAVKHYTPLHNRIPGKKYGRSSDCRNAVYASERILRLPMEVSEDEAKRITQTVNEVLHEKKRSVRRIEAGTGQQAAQAV